MAVCNDKPDHPQMETGQGQVTLFIFLSIISQQVSAVTDEHTRRATSRQMYCKQTCAKLVSDRTKLTMLAIFSMVDVFEYGELFAESPILTYPTGIWRLCWR